MDLVGFEPTTMVDQTKFDLKAITTPLLATCARKDLSPVKNDNFPHFFGLLTFRVRPGATFHQWPFWL